MHLLFCAHLMDIIFIFGGVELRHFSVQNALMCMVCVICNSCNSNSFHSFIFKRFIIFVNTLKIAPFIWYTFDKKILICSEMLEIEMFSTEMLRGVWFLKSVIPTVFIRLYSNFHIGCSYIE